MPSRITPSSPDLVAEIRKLRARVARLESRTTADPVTLAAWWGVGGVPVNEAEWATTHASPFTRTQAGVLWVETWAENYGTARVDVRLWCPDFDLGSAPVSSARDAHGELLRSRLDLPEQWPPGQARWVHVQARLTAGQSALLQFVRGWQL